MNRAEAVAYGYKVGELQTVGELRGELFNVGQTAAHDAICWITRGLDADTPLEAVEEVLREMGNAERVNKCRTGHTDTGRGVCADCGAFL